jgi:hypothetical protein
VNPKPPRTDATTLGMRFGDGSQFYPFNAIAASRTLGFRAGAIDTGRHLLARLRVT